MHPYARKRKPCHPGQQTAHAASFIASHLLRDPAAPVACQTAPSSPGTDSRVRRLPTSCLAKWDRQSSHLSRPCMGGMLLFPTIDIDYTRLH